LTLSLNFAERRSLPAKVIDRRSKGGMDAYCLRNFEANRERDGQLFARWSVLDGADKKVAVVKESRVTRNAQEKTTDGSVAALSEAVGDLSREIANAVSAIDGPRK